MSRSKRRSITQGLASYVRRDWAAARQAKDGHWTSVVRERGPLAALQAAEELRLQVLRERPDWPTDVDRAADFEAHERLGDLLRRGSGPGQR